MTPINTTTSPVYLPNVFTSSIANQTTTFQFDSKNRLVDEKSTSGSPIVTDEIMLTYDNNDRVIETDQYINNVFNEKNTYTYNGSTINVSSVIFPNNPSPVLENSAINLNSNQQIIKTAYISIYYTFTYDSAGNVSSYSYFYTPTAATPTTVANFTYDNHNSIYLNVKGNNCVFSVTPNITNNILTETIITPGTSTTQTTTYSYVYNADGYPTSCTLVTTGSSVVNTETFTYTVK